LRFDFTTFIEVVVVVVVALQLTHQLYSVVDVVVVVNWFCSKNFEKKDAKEKKVNFSNFSRSLVYLIRVTSMQSFKLNETVT
jgi:hypothetical protein